MLIAFKCYDVNNDEKISEEEVTIVMRNIPLHIGYRYGKSFRNYNEEE